MTGTEKVTTAVEQALFLSTEAGTSVVASSLDRQGEQAWLGVVEPHLGFAGTPDSMPALSYVVSPHGFAAVLRRTWTAGRPDLVVTHALLGKDDMLTPGVALSISDWPGWRHEPPADGRLPRLPPDELWAPDAAARLREQALVQGDLLARSLAWVLESPNSRIGFVGCPVADRIPLLWALHEIGAPVLPGRAWTFATHDDGAAEPVAITCFSTPPADDPATGRIVIDLRRGQGATPRNEYRANALVYRFEYGVDPPGVEASPSVLPVPAPVPVAAPVPRPQPPQPPPPPEPVRSALPPWQWATLVRDLTDARDVRALDGALVELEYAVARIDERDVVRKALANAGWATAVIDRHVPFELRDAVYDRLVQVAFGATGPGRATPSARDDARRLVIEAESTDLVRAIARAGAERHVADVLARRWLNEHQPVAPEPRRGPVGRLVRHPGFRVTVSLLLTLVVGLFLGGVIW